MIISSDGLLRFPRPNENANIRLVCFPASGADAFIWDPYAAFLPDTIELCAIQLPNRGPDLEQHQERSKVIATVAESLLNNAREGQTLVFHGYCIGSFWAYDVALYLRDHANVEIAHFIVAGCMPPHLRGPLMEFMKTDEYIEYMASMYPPHTPQHQYIRSVVPAMKHDGKLLSQEMASEVPLSCPLSVFGTENDQYVPNSQDLWAWKTYTTSSFSVQLFEGDHYFGVYNPELLMNAIVERIQAEALPV